MTLPGPEETPRSVSFGDLVPFEDLDQRVSAVTVLFGSVVGVNDGNVEWVPDDVPPSEPERLAWLWLCNPELAREIEPVVTGRLRMLVKAYAAGEMAEWWRMISQPVEEPSP